MKQQFKKITTTLLAFTVLFSTFSFTVEKHFCGDFLIDVAVLGNLEVCLTDISADSSIKMKKCCKDEVQKIEGQDELQLAKVEKTTFKTLEFLITYVVSCKNTVVRYPQKNTFYNGISPPGIALDYQVAYQTFIV